MDAYLARKPVFDTAGNVFAYELMYSAAGDAEIVDKGENVLFGLDVRRVTGKARAFIKFDDEMLRARLPKSFSRDILTVEVYEEQLLNKGVMNICRDLKDCGYMIALDDFEYKDEYKEVLEFADLVEIDFRKPQYSVEATTFVCRQMGKLMLAENIETREQYEYAKRVGCTFMQGFYFAKPELNDSGGIQPLPASIMQAMKIMAEPSPEIEQVVDVLSRDSAVCQSLLRLINSVYFGFTTKISSINQAIVILGIDYLREWIYLIAVQKLMRNDSVESMRMSFLMAKFCKKIALQIHDAAKTADSFYLMGLLSMVVFGGDRVLAQALEEFPLTPEIKKGLLRRGGIYSDVFEMAFNYILGDWDRYEVIAESYRLDADVISNAYVECAEDVEKTNMM